MSVDRPVGLNNVGNTCYLNSLLQVSFDSSLLFLQTRSELTSDSSLLSFAVLLHHQGASRDGQQL